MQELSNLMNTPVVAGKDGVPILNVSHVAAIALGVLGLYFMIPERKRKNLLK